LAISIHVGSQRVEATHFLQGEVEVAAAAAMGADFLGFFL